MESILHQFYWELWKIKLWPICDNILCLHSIII